MSDGEDHPSSRWRGMLVGALQKARALFQEFKKKFQEFKLSYCSIC